MNAQAITRALKGKWRGGYGMVCCPAHDDASPSCRLRNGEKGLLVRCYAGCDARDILAALRRQGLIEGNPVDSSSPFLTPEPEPPNESESIRRAVALSFWNGCGPAETSPAANYWHKVRKLGVPMPWVLRFGRVPYGWRGLWRPAMVAMIQDARGEFLGVHCTYLRPDGMGKAEDVLKPKLIFGPVSGGAVQLFDAQDRVALGEGIETCASYVQIRRRVAWAALSTGGMRAIDLPRRIKHVTLIKEFDAADLRGRAPSMAAIEATTKKLKGERRMVLVDQPDDERFNDFNDQLRSA